MQGLRFNVYMRVFLFIAVLTPVATVAVDIADLPYWISLIVIAIALAILVTLFFRAGESVKQYRQSLAEALTKMVKGDFNPPPSDVTDDELINATLALAVLLKRFTDELTTKKQAAGNSPLEEKRWDGAYREALKNVNANYTNYLKDFDTVTEFINTASRGELRINTTLSGERAKTAEAIEALTGNIRLLLAEVQSTQQAVAEGRLNYKADSVKLTGEWARAAARLGETVDAVAAPVSELKNLLERLRRGELSVTVSRSFKGEYGELFQSVDQLAGMLNMHNKELLAVLGDIARYTPGRSARRDYGGAFPSFKSAVSDACERLEQLDKTMAKPAASFTPGKPAISIHTTAKPTAKTDSFTSAQPSLGHRSVVAPSAAKVYDAKDFGKY
jgi:uncharacterized protein YukE